jgi:bleomycin hydrolase
MGANQSRPTDAAIQEKLLERLQALQVKDDIRINEKEDYVCVDNHKSMYIGALSNARLIVTQGHSSTPLASYRQDVSTSTIGEWEKELLEDAKVRTTCYHSASLLMQPHRTALL